MTLNDRGESHTWALNCTKNVAVRQLVIGLDITTKVRNDGIFAEIAIEVANLKPKSLLILREVPITILTSCSLSVEAETSNDLYYFTHFLQLGFCRLL